MHDPLFPRPVELGAEFVHGKPPEIWWHGPIGTPARPRIAAPTSSSKTARPGKRLERNRAASSRECPTRPEQSFPATISRTPGAPPEAQRAAAGYVEGFNAARQERISVQLAGARGGSRRQRSRATATSASSAAMDSLVDSLWHEIDPATARSIWERRSAPSSGGAARSGWPPANARLTAPRAIMTVPLGVLQSGPSASTRPASLRDACAALEMGRASASSCAFAVRFGRTSKHLADAAFLHAEDPFMRDLVDLAARPRAGDHRLVRRAARRGCARRPRRLGPGELSPA